MPRFTHALALIWTKGLRETLLCGHPDFYTHADRVRTRLTARGGRISMRSGAEALLGIHSKVGLEAPECGAPAA